MNKWLSVEFESSTIDTLQFKSFAREFKNFIKKNLPDGAVLASFLKGHFYVSGFIEKEEKFVYFSISDVRHFPNEWYKSVLIRTAESPKDYSGGYNSYTTVPDFKVKVANLLRR